MRQPQTGFHVREHTGGVRSVVFLPKGRFATAGNDGTIRIWNRQSQESEKTIRDTVGGVLNLAVSADKLTLVAAWDQGVVKCFPIDAQGTELIWAGLPGRIHGLACHPQKPWIAFGCNDNRFPHQGKVVIRDYLIGKDVLCLEGHQESIVGLSFSKDGRYLVSRGADHAVMVWDMALGKRVHTIRFPTHHPCGIALSATTDRLVVGGSRMNSGSRQGELLIWDGLPSLKTRKP